jgi:hypothetical protein
MCVRTWDGKTRRIYAAGNLCLLSAMLLTQLGGNWNEQHRDWFDFVRGLLLGLAIVMLAWVVRRKKTRLG